MNLNDTFAECVDIRVHTRVQNIVDSHRW